MAQIIILGAGLNGLSTAMVLARDGHEVTVLERDAAEPPPAAQAWDDWSRRGVNQFRLPHFMLSRWRMLMEQELPEALAAVRSAGGTTVNSVALLPEAVRGPIRPTDERFDTVTARRPVLEAAIARSPRARPESPFAEGSQSPDSAATSGPARGT